MIKHSTMKPLTILLVFLVHPSIQTDCLLDIAGRAPKSPLIVTLNNTLPNPVTSVDFSLFFKFGEQFLIGCPGGSIEYVIPEGETVMCFADDKSLTQLVTMTDDLFFDFENMECILDEENRPDVVEFMTSSCEGGNVWIQESYRVADRLLTVLEICFNTMSYSPFYVKHVTNEWSDKLPVYSPPAEFYFEGLFPKTDLFAVYNVTNFHHEFRTRFGLLPVYISDDIYLERGFLANSDDFFSPFQRDVTVNYVNVAPRWNTVTQGNWKAMEDSLRSLIQRGGFGDTTILTGVLRNIALTDTDGLIKSVFLQIDTLHASLPIPAWFWKIMHSPEANSGVLFLVNNNPFLDSRPAEQEFFNSICTQDVLGNLTWVKNLQSGSEFGSIFACPLDTSVILDLELTEVVTNLLKSSGKKMDTVRLPQVGGPTPRVKSSPPGLFSSTKEKEIREMHTKKIVKTPS